MFFIEKHQFRNAFTPIGNYAFSSCGLETVTIGENVERIGTETFSGSSLKIVTISVSVKLIGNYVFQLCSVLETIDIREGMETIEYCASSQCSSLKNITIPSSVISICDGAF